MSERETMRISSTLKLTSHCIRNSFYHLSIKQLFEDLMNKKRLLNASEGDSVKSIEIMNFEGVEDQIGFAFQIQ